MSYHNNERQLRAAIEDAQKFINDRARLEEGLRRTLAKCCVPAPDIETVIADVRTARFDSIGRAIEAAREPVREGETPHPAMPAVCSDCPPAVYPTDKTRCEQCPRRAPPTGEGDA